MKKILQTLFVFAALMWAVNANAQLRYLDEVFTTVSVDSNIVYGHNYGYLTGFNTLENLKMDVYTPDGDTSTNRPVVILMHAGSFLPGSLTGFTFADKNENCIVEMCKRYAKRGYVAVSMTYRLGWNPTSADADVRAGTIINAVYRAMQDAKNCVRYFRSTYADSSNMWGIDPTKFVLGGTNSGAYVALAASNLNKPSEFVIPKLLDINGNSYVDTALTGNFDGFGGTQNNDNYPGYSSDFNCVLSLGGAVADTSFIEAGETSVIGFQGTSEQLTPYNTAVVVTTTLTPVIEVSGTGDFMPVVAAKGNNSGFSPNSFPAGPKNTVGGVPTTSIDGLYPFYGQGFEPWNWYNGTNPSINPTANMAKAMAYIDTIMGYATPRMYRQMIDNTYGEPLGIHTPVNSVEVNLMPNPANTYVNVNINSLQKPMQTIQLFDLTGRMVKEQNNIGGYNTVVDVQTLNNGVYILSLQLADGTTSSTRVVINR